MTQVGVKPLDIARLLNMFMKKRNVSFFKYRLNNFDAYQLTCGDNSYSFWSIRPHFGQLVLIFWSIRSHFGTSILGYMH